MPDPKTALIFLISTSAISGFMVLLLWKLHRDLRGLGIVAVSNLLLCLTFASLLDRSAASIVAQNTLVVASQFTLCEGVLVFTGRRAAWRLLAGMLALTVVLWTLMLWLAPDNLPLRISAITVLSAVVYTRFAILLLRGQERLGVAEWVMLSAFILHTFLLVARTALTLMHPDPGFGWSPPVLGWSFLEMTLITLLVFFSILLMVGARLAGDLQRHSAALATERRMKSELRQLLHMLGHELHTPLAVIARAAGTIRAHLADHAAPEVEHHIAALQDTVERVNRLTRNLLTAERADMEQPKPEILNLAAVTAEAADLLAGKWGQGRLRVTSPAHPLRVMGDRELLFTAVVNLLDNALKYSPPQAAVLVHVDAETNGDKDESQSGGEVALRIRDRGIGFPEEQMAQLGQRFFRAGNARHHAGTGLGLYMVKAIAQRHGGRLALANASGGGAEVTLILPNA